MSTDTGAFTEQVADSSHATPRQYVVVALVLLVVTSLEVWVSYLDDILASGLLIALLIVMAVVKFGLVASWYMHLRTDRLLYRRLFVLGTVGAIALYAIVLASFQVFDR